MGFDPSPREKRFDEYWAVPGFRQVAPNTKLRIKISLKGLSNKNIY